MNQTTKRDMPQRRRGVPVVSPLGPRFSPTEGILARRRFASNAGV